MSQVQEMLSKNAIPPGIIINDVKYSYLIDKSKGKDESLLIKLYEPNQKSKMFFIYEAQAKQLTKDIEFLASCKSLDEMIDSLKNIFAQGKIQVEENNGIFNMEIKESLNDKKYVIELTKHEIDQTEKNYIDSLNKSDELKRLIISKEEESKSKFDFKYLKSDYFLRKIFDTMKKSKTLEIMKYNKRLQKRLNLSINDYKEYSQLYSSIELELKPADNEYGNFINIPDDEIEYYHIYFDNSNEEKKRNYLNENEKVKMIKILIGYQIKSFKKIILFL